MIKETFKRWLSFVLAIMILFTSMPLQAFANDTVVIDNPDVIQEFVNSDVTSSVIENKQQLNGTRLPIMWIFLFQILM